MNRFAPMLARGYCGPAPKRFDRGFQTSGESRHTSFVSRPPHPFIRGSLVRRKTTASDHFEHDEGECPTFGKRWVSDTPSKAKTALRLGIANHATDQ
jgi:hypothetical protein